MASPLSTFLPRLSLLSKSLPPQHHRLLLGPTRPELSSFECLAGQTGFFTRLGKLIKEKAKSNVEKLSSGFSKTRDNLAVIDELLLYWNIADTDRILDELEEVFLRDEEYPQVAQASWRQLLQQDKKLSGRHLTRMGTVDPERAYKGSSKNPKGSRCYAYTHWNEKSRWNVLPSFKNPRTRKKARKVEIAAIKAHIYIFDDKRGTMRNPHI